MAGVTLVQDLSSASWQLLARFAGRFDVHRLQKERARAMGDAVPLRFRRMFLVDGAARRRPLPPLSLPPRPPPPSPKHAS